MTFIRNAILLFPLALAAAACNQKEGGSVFTYISVLDNDRIAVHAPSRPDAIVNAKGEISIANTAIATTSAQQALLVRYYSAVIVLRKDAIATGEAGTQTAATAIGSVISGLANGEPDKISDKVDAQAAKVNAAANQVCQDLAEIKSAQAAIADQLPSFKPYALIDEKTVHDCQHD